MSGACGAAKNGSGADVRTRPDSPAASLAGPRVRFTAPRQTAVGPVLFRSLVPFVAVDPGPVGAALRSMCFF
jgi:hypothetical protein